MADYIEMRFRVSGAKSTYRLTAETYHGAGGSWTLDCEAPDCEAPTEGS